MISRDTSPPPLSDDSAIGSTASCSDKSSSDSIQNKHYQQRNQQQHPRQHAPQPQMNVNRPRPDVERILVSKQELVSVSNRMRYNNTTLISRSIRTHLFCFDDLDTQRFDRRPDYLVNFISIGVNKCASSIQRPVSILWPMKYDKMVEQLADLDAYLINTEFLEKPIDWMLRRRLTVVPKCHQCKSDMTLVEEKDTVKWECHKTITCFNTYTPLQRPAFFRRYEHIGLIKILFTVYFWSTCTQFDFVNKRLSLERQTLHGIWTSIQKVCRTALEDSNTIFQLSNNPEQEIDLNEFDEQSVPIDLISIKFNRSYIVCAKHPNSNKVRLGLVIPGTSTYSFVGLTKSWFASNSHIRVCEPKFLELTSARPDLKVTIETRSQMINKDGVFHRESAFGYLICQLTHTFKDFDSSTLTQETLKLVLAELQWRELYGTTPIDAFTNIIDHMAKYAISSECYIEPKKSDIKKIDTVEGDIQMNESDFIYAEKYFYAVVEPVDEKGIVIRRFGKPENLEYLSLPVARFICHLCNDRYESFYFSMHMIKHVELNRKESDIRYVNKTKMIECKHCFKPHRREDIANHSALLRTHYHTIKHGCRICCIKFADRSSYLKHMRRTHSEHETPYRCPSCKFASSFQREVFIHFQEEHRNSFILLCPICLRSFTIQNTQNLTPDQMRLVSSHVYDHFLQHYVIANSYNCTNCCLSFLTKEKLQRHKVQHHNPLEIHLERLVKVQSFIVSREEEPYCVRAMPSELFIANKRPNVMARESNQTNKVRPIQRGRQRKINPDDSDEFIDESDDNNNNDHVYGIGNDSDEVMISDSDDSYKTADDDEGEDKDDRLVHVRNFGTATRFLDGGKPAIEVSKGTKLPDDRMSSEKIIEYMSKVNRADSVVANQSVILTPEGLPAKCIECLEYITVDHYVASISCKHCKYLTNCPRAATKHQIERHNN